MWHFDYFVYFWELYFRELFKIWPEIHKVHMKFVSLTFLVIFFNIVGLITWVSYGDFRYCK